MIDMCLRIDGLPQGITLLPLQGAFVAINLPRALPWAMSRLPFQGVLWDERHYPGCRFAMPWAMCRLPFQGVLWDERHYPRVSLRYALGYDVQIVLSGHALNAHT